MSLLHSHPYQLHIQPADMIHNMVTKTSKPSACSLHTGSSSRFATRSRQAVLKWSYKELVKSSKARWPLPRLMRRPPGSSAARPTGRTTCHAAPYTAKTATQPARKYESESRNTTETFIRIFNFTDNMNVGCDTKQAGRYILTLWRQKAPLKQWYLATVYTMSHLRGQ